MDRATFPQGSRLLQFLAYRALVLLLLVVSNCALAARAAEALDPSLAAAGSAERIAGSARTTSAYHPCPPLADRPQDDVWYVNTRPLDCEPDTVSFAAGVARHHFEDGWIAADIDSVLLAPHQMTIVYVHGNRMTHQDAIERGWSVYQALATRDAPPIRMVIWSWPSEKISHRPLRDVRVKAYRAEMEGVYLARFLSEVPAEQNVSLVGYSYGARVIASALHVLGGGVVNGRGLLGDVAPSHHWLRATLIAPAIERSAFAPGNSFQNAAGVVEHPQVLFNPCDPVLRRYRFIECQGRVQAMGFAGIVGGMPVTQFNVSSYIGKSHDERRYLRSAAIMGSIRPYLLWQN